MVIVSTESSKSRVERFVAQKKAVDYDRYLWGTQCR
jgi:hypothetical protein